MYKTIEIKRKCEFDSKDISLLSAQNMQEFYHEIRRLVARQCGCSPLLVRLRDVKLVPDTYEERFDTFIVNYTIKFEINLYSMEKEILDSLPASDKYSVNGVFFYVNDKDEFVVHVSVENKSDESPISIAGNFDEEKIKVIAKSYLYQFIKPVVTIFVFKE